MAAKFQTASPADVRVWAHESDLVTGRRGKFTAEVIEAFNKSHNLKGGPRLRYVQGGYRETRLVTFKSDSGRPVTRRVDAKAARAHAGKSHTKGYLSTAEWQAAAKAGV